VHHVSGITFIRCTQYQVSSMTRDSLLWRIVFITRSSKTVGQKKKKIRLIKGSFSYLLINIWKDCVINKAQIYPKPNDIKLQVIQPSTAHHYQYGPSFHMLIQRYENEPFMRRIFFFFCPTVLLDLVMNTIRHSRESLVTSPIFFQDTCCLLKQVKYNRSLWQYLF
jgi:hypothetical protein